MNKANKQINYSHLKIVTNDSNDTDISCSQCSSKNYRKAGFNKGKQRYKCKDCNRQFVNNSCYQKLVPPKVFDFNSDVWTPEHIGLKSYSYKARKENLYFIDIELQWFKYYVKKFILYSASNKTLGTLIHAYLPSLKRFALFLVEVGFHGGIQDINRELVLEFLTYTHRLKLSSKTRGQDISVLSLFFETGVINNWFKVQDYLFQKEDYPKRDKAIPRYIPEEVIFQLNQHLDKLPPPIMRMVLVLQECGLRVGELCLLPIHCLKEDQRNQYRLQFMRWKMKTEDSIPISLELAKVIKEQQEYIKSHLGDEFQYLFCGREAKVEFKPSAKVITSESFINHLKRLAEDNKIKDNSGKIWNFQSHQFRHTVGTRMINNGVPQHIIQRYLGHESPTMTSVYAHIHDHTLRQEIEKYHESRVVNFQGEAVELEQSILSSNDDLEWFKKNVQARALEHGYCARPKVLGDCDITGFDGCYDCPHWRTNKNFLPILKDTLERTTNVIEKARNCGWELQVKKNQPIQSNLQ
jgi:integrase/DNA-directed RNA polymerase subunit RPC12/RpoP